MQYAIAKIKAANDTAAYACPAFINSFCGKPAVGYGRHRITFRLNEKWVVKIPIHELGYSDNKYEYFKYTTNRESIYAKCRMINGVLIMEHVRPAVSYANLPDWVYDIDSLQVGYNKNGRLVAYDYGSR